MKANELRIGNYVEITNIPNYLENDEIRYVKIQKLTSIAIANISWKSNGFIDDCFYNDIIPIPLTEQWLIDFGFKKEKGFTPSVFRLMVNGEWPNEFMIRYFFSDSHIQLRDIDDFDKVVALEENKHKHVHQLQNLYFALTGKELINK